MTEPAIVTRGLTRRYGERVAVKPLDLAVAEGTIFGLLGPNGAGKSTTLKMICGALAPTAGEVRVKGLSPTRDREKLKRVIGMMPQGFALYDHLTVVENLRFYAAIYLRSRRLEKARVAELLDEIGLHEHAGTRAAALSGGWRQRLALACAVVHRPAVLFLDEPTAGVDPMSRRLFWDLIGGVQARGTTVFVTTHYMEEVERCHQVGLLAGGELRVCGAPSELRAAAARAADLIAVAADRPELAVEALRGAPGVVDVYRYGERIHAAWPAGGGALDAARAALAAAGVTAHAVEPRGATMEDVFVYAAPEVAR